MSITDTIKKGFLLPKILQKSRIGPIKPLNSLFKTNFDHSTTQMIEQNQYIATYQKETQAELAKYKQAEKTWSDDKTAYEESFSQLEKQVGFCAHPLSDFIVIINYLMGFELI